MRCAMCDKQYEPKSEELACAFCPECLEMMFMECFIPDETTADKWLEMVRDFPEARDLLAAVTTTQAQYMMDWEECDRSLIPRLLAMASEGGMESLGKGYQKAADIFYHNGQYDTALYVLSKLIKVKTLSHASYCTTPDPLEFCKFYSLKARCQEQLEELWSAEEDINTAIVYGLMVDQEEKDVLLRDLCRQSARVYAKLEKYNQSYAMIEKAIYYAKQVVARCDKEEDQRVLAVLNEEQIKVLVNEMMKRNGMKKVFPVGEIQD